MKKMFKLLCSSIIMIMMSLALVVTVSAIDAKECLTESGFDIVRGNGELFDIIGNIKKDDYTSINILVQKQKKVGDDIELEEFTITTKDDPKAVVTISTEYPVYSIFYTITYSDDSLQEELVIVTIKDQQEENELTLKISPSNKTVTVGKKVIFEVTVKGGEGPYTYKWEVSTDGKSWADATDGTVKDGFTYTIAETTKAMSGNIYRCTVTDKNENSKSVQSTLTVTNTNTGGSSNNTTSTSYVPYYAPVNTVNDPYVYEGSGSSSNTTSSNITSAPSNGTSTPTAVISARDLKVDVGESFDIMNYIKATDVDGADITKKVTVSGTVNTSKAGTYPITYKVVDKNGNSVTRTIKVTVGTTSTIPTTKPGSSSGSGTVTGPAKCTPGVANSPCGI